MSRVTSAIVRKEREEERKREKKKRRKREKGKERKRSTHRIN